MFWAICNDKSIIAFFLTLLAGLTDWLDGLSARYFKIESSFGRSFDPIADKVFIASVCMGFILTNKMPLWLLFIFVFRDLAIILGAFWIQRKQISYSLSPITISKYNTFLQMILIGWLLLMPLLPPYPFYHVFSNLLIYGTLITTLFSGFVYAKIFKRLCCTPILS